MKPDNPAQRYRRQASECELNAKTAANGVDREAWEKLAHDWAKLAKGADVNPRMNAEPVDGVTARLRRGI
jgi:hypothetical protein